MADDCPAAPAGPLTCCACSRPAVGRVFDMQETRDAAGDWRWTQSPAPRGYCDRHADQHACCRWIDRRQQVHTASPMG